MKPPEGIFIPLEASLNTFYFGKAEIEKKPLITDTYKGRLHSGEPNII